MLLFGFGLRSYKTCKSPSVDPIIERVRLELE